MALFQTCSGCIADKSLEICQRYRPVAVEFSGYAGNHLRSSSYGVSANRERSRHSEATAESAAFGVKSLKHFVSIHLFSKLAQQHIPSQPGSAQDWSPPGYGAGPSNPQ